MNFNNKNKKNERSFQMILFLSQILRFAGDGRKQSVVFFFEIDSRLLLLRPFLSFTRPENEIKYPTENIKRSADVENIGPFAGRSLFSKKKKNKTKQNKTKQKTSTDK